MGGSLARGLRMLPPPQSGPFALRILAVAKDEGEATKAIDGAAKHAQGKGYATTYHCGWDGDGKQLWLTQIYLSSEGFVQQQKDEAYAALLAAGELEYKDIHVLGDASEEAATLLNDMAPKVTFFAAGVGYLSPPGPLLKDANKSPPFGLWAQATLKDADAAVRALRTVGQHSTDKGYDTIFFHGIKDNQIFQLELWQSSETFIANQQDTVWQGLAGPVGETMAWSYNVFFGVPSTEAKPFLDAFDGPVYLEDKAGSLV